MSTQNATSTSLLITLPQTADILSAASVTTAASTPGSRRIATATGVGFVAVYPTGSLSEAIFLNPELDWYEDAGAIYSRQQYPAGYTFAYGVCHAPAFIVPPWAGTIWINNDQAASIYFRFGTANGSGLTIGKPGDASTYDNVRGQKIPDSGAVGFGVGEFTPGPVHLLGSAGGQTATVNFSK